MLLLTRKLGEELIIGDDVTISVVRVQGNRVQLGIDAPQDISIRREDAPSQLPDQRNRFTLQTEPHT